MGDEQSNSDAERVDHGEYWRIEELELQSETYCFVGKGGPPSPEAVAKAKKQFAEDYDVKYRHTVGKKIETAPTRSGGAIVYVCERPKMASHEVVA